MKTRFQISRYSSSLLTPSGHLLVEVAPVVVDFRAGAAGAGVAHRPPVVLLAKAQHACGVGAGLDPEPFGLVVVLVDRKPEPLDGQFELVDQQVPGKGNGVLLEIVAKREIAQHLEEGVMARAGADIFQVIVLAADAHALLAGRGALIVALFQPQEDVLELVHAGVDQQQRRVVVRHQAAAGHDGVTALMEIIKPDLANFVGRKAFHRQARSHE